MSPDILIHKWDGQDIIGADCIIVVILNTAQFVSVRDHKTKTPGDKSARVSNKVPDGIYELLVEPRGRKRLTPEELLGIFPANDSRNMFGTVKGDVTKEQIIEGMQAVKQAGGAGLLLKIVKKDPTQQALATVELRTVTDLIT